MDVARSAGTLDLAVPGGWTAERVAFPATRPGEGANIKVPVTVPAGASGDAGLTATYRSDGKQASGSRTVTVTP
ncbi:hypothetical protein GCM10010392_14610 [Streptomyces clavifer]|nr:hypothetical protein GCM10010392_14610 [Streptomyces clavifer]